jgi:hypothetical protein
MGEAGLDALRRMVVDDRLLRGRLLGHADRPSFIAEVVVLASERGIELTAEDVGNGLDQARRRRRERWV